MTTSSLKHRRQDIDGSHRQLGDTLEALTYKIDVPAGVWDKVRNAKHTVPGKAEEVKKKVQTHAHQAKQHLPEDAETLPAQADEVAAQTTHQALAELPSPVAARIEPPVAARIDPPMATATQHPLPTAAAAAGAVGLLLVLLWALRHLLHGNR